MVGAVVGLAMPAGAPAAPVGWSIQPSPNPPGASASVLAAVSCSADDSCMAVGYYTKPGLDSTLAERWNGSAWAIVPTPNATSDNTLSGLSCVRSGACTAVGLSVSPSSVVRPLVMAWNGHTWTIQQTPTIAGGGAGLNSVSCITRDSCTAVGSFTGSGPNAQSQPLAEHWNGAAWRVQATPNPQAENGSFLDGVSCTATNACTAGGNYTYADVDQAIFALRWNGTSWLIQPQPNPGGQGQNTNAAVSCAGPTFCVTVGSWVDLADTPLTLAEAWNGASWVREPTPNPAGATGAGLNGVSCTGSSDCTAVGAVNGTGSSGATLAESQHGSTWTVQSTPNPSDAVFSVLSGVDCGPAGSCLAVGNFYNGSATQTLVERYAP